MTAAATTTTPVAAAACLIHKRGVGGKPTVDDVSSVLHTLGFQKSHDVVVRHGVVNCTAALAYVAAQKGRYAARNPGGLVRWLLANKDGLSGWQASRLRGFLVRFRSLPEWLRERIARWLGLSAPPEARPRVKTPPRSEASQYPTWEEVEAATARDERRWAEYLKRTGQG